MSVYLGWFGHATRLVHYGSILAWAAGKAAAEGVRPAGALGPAEAFGADALESACANAGFHRERPKSG